MWYKVKLIRNGKNAGRYGILYYRERDRKEFWDARTFECPVDAEERGMACTMWENRIDSGDVILER